MRWCHCVFPCDRPLVREEHGLVRNEQIWGCCKGVIIICCMRTRTSHVCLFIYLDVPSWRIWCSWTHEALARAHAHVCSYICRLRCVRASFIFQHQRLINPIGCQGRLIRSVLQWPTDASRWAWHRCITTALIYLAICLNWFELAAV